MSAVLDTDNTQPEATLSAKAEEDIQSALYLINSGLNPKTVLRTLYCLARMDGILTAAGK